jgi:hypothetical protein
MYWRQHLDRFFAALSIPASLRFQASLHPLQSLHLPVSDKRGSGIQFHAGIDHHTVLLHSQIVATYGDFVDGTGLFTSMASDARELLQCPGRSRLSCGDPRSPLLLFRLVRVRIPPLSYYF